MSFHRFQQLSALCGLLTIFTLTALRAHAANGRDFAGIYQIKSVSQKNGTVTVKLSINFWNYGDSALTGATVYLADRVLQGQRHGAFNESVALKKRESVKLSGAFTVPASEFAMWKQGMSPLFTISFKDGNGKQVERKIELLEMPNSEGK